VDIVGDSITLLTGGASAFAAIAAWRAALRSNKAASIMADIERARHHADLKPQFAVTFEQTSGDRAMLKLTLMGPPGLGDLDAVEVMIRQDTHTRGASTIAGDLSREEVAAVVWGPYRFAAGVDGVDPTGRWFAARPLPHGESLEFPLQRTDKPWWWPDGSQWRREQDGKPVRLEATCRWGGFEPWVVRMEVPTPTPPVSVTFPPT
jgi:hypothetical protein